MLAPRSPLALAPLPLALVLAHVVLAASCSPTLHTNGAFVSCNSDADCFDGSICNPNTALCVDAGADIVAPSVLDAVFTDEGGPYGLDEHATFDITFNEAVADARVYVIDDAGSDVEGAVSVDDSVAHVDFTVAAALASGAYDVFVDAADAGDNAVAGQRARLVLVVDRDGPVAVAVTVVVTADAATNPLFPGSPAALRAGSALAIEAVFDEALGGPPTVEIASLSTSGVVSDNGRTARFTFAADALGALIAGGDRSVSFSIDAADVHSNQRTSDNAGTVEVDTTSPPAPSFATLTRAPWHSTQTSFATSIDAHAEGASLVLALAGETVVEGNTVPLLLSRVVPDADGAVHVDLSTDVAGLQLVAVDAAGNMSAPVRAAETRVIATVGTPQSPVVASTRERFTGALIDTGVADVDVGEALRAGGASVRARPRWQPLTTVTPRLSPAAGAVAWDPFADALMVVADGRTFHIIDGQWVESDVRRLPARRGGSLTLDEARGRVVFFGGAVANAVRNDLWEWDGRDWSLLFDGSADGGVDDVGPAPRIGHFAVYSPTLGGVVLGLGCSRLGSGQNACNTGGFPQDVWLWDGSRFTALCNGEVGVGDTVGLCGEAGATLGKASFVDDDGRIVVFGGQRGTAGVIALPVPGTAHLPVFDGGQFQLECGGDCDVAAGDLVDGAAVLGASGFGFHAGLVGNQRMTYGVDGVDVEAVTGLGNVYANASITGPVAAAFSPTGDLWIVVHTNEGGEVWRVRGTRAVRVSPSALPAGRTGTFRDDGDVFVGVSGCADFACGAVNSQPELWKDGGVGAVASSSVAARVVVGAPDFFVFLPEGGDTATVVIDGVARGTSNPLPAQAFGAPEPSTLIVDNARSALLFYQASSLDGALVNRIDAIDPDGTFTVLCEGDCDDPRTPLAQSATVTTPDGVFVFGGDDGNHRTVADALTRQNGEELTPLAASGPLARRASTLVYDDVRDGLYLFGGSANRLSPFISPFDQPASCNVAGQQTCSDLWFYDVDDDSFSLVDAAAPFGNPSGRLRPTLVVEDGSVFVLSGQADGADVWRLSRDAQVPPAQFLSVPLDGFGVDGGLTPTSVRARFCGDAKNAAGAAIDVDVSLFVDNGFVAGAVSDAGNGCIDVSFDDGVDHAPRDADRRLILMATPHLTNADASGALDASLTTTTFEATVALR